MFFHIYPLSTKVIICEQANYKSAACVLYRKWINNFNKDVDNKKVKLKQNKIK